jgi:hypothetical protein
MPSEGLNALLVAIPLLLVLVAFMLRADEFFSISDKRRSPPDGRKNFAMADKDGENVLTDPDGRPSGGRESRADNGLKG